jgi:hypothetical protein
MEVSSMAGDALSDIDCSSSIAAAPPSVAASASVVGTSVVGSAANAPLPRPSSQTQAQAYFRSAAERRQWPPQGAVPILEPYPDEEDDDDAVVDGATAPSTAPSRRGPPRAAENNNVVSTAVSALLSFLPSFE